MKKILIRRAEIELYFRNCEVSGPVWVMIEVKTELPFTFDFDSHIHTLDGLKYTHWTWLEEEKIYMVFNEKDVIP